MTSVLKKGDCIGIAASSSPFDKVLFHRGIDLLKKWGFEVFYRMDIFSRERYLAGSDERRAEELTELFLNKKVKAILFARGGYGSIRILPHLKTDLLKRNLKPVVGFSDLTSLLAFLRQRFEIPTLYGPVVTQLGNKPSARTMETLFWHLTQSRPISPIDLKGPQILRKGSARGILAGGCLSLVTGGMGTPYELNTDGTIFFFEDTDEKVYALDRMLTQLRHAGKFKKVRGFLIGSLKPPKNDPHSIKAMLQNLLGDLGVPVIFGIPAGHTADFASLPFGKRVRIDTDGKKIHFDEPFLQ